jgi:hypothetical protein
MSELNKIISIAILEIAESRGINVCSLNSNTILLESGLDSLGFAILVARLEEELGYDPFSIMDVAIYPHTLGEFVSIYERFRPSL